MHGVRVPKRDAEQVRRRLMGDDILLRDYQPIRDGDYVIFPASECPEGFDCVERDFPARRKKPRSLEDALREFLDPEDVQHVTKSFDIIGHVAIIRIPDELWAKRKEIGEAILRVHPNVRTVAAEVGPHQGVFRVQPVEIIAGEPNLVTEYREFGVRLRLEVGKTYFSPRLSYERYRIAKQVRPGEFIAALLAGVGPFPLVIHRFQPNIRVYAVELNPDAYRFLVENIRLNRAEGKIEPILGDVRDVVPARYPHQADRVLMPSPILAEDFLDVALAAAKYSGAIIHTYALGPNDDPFTEKEYELLRFFRDRGWDAKVLNRRVVRSYSPRLDQVSFDVYVKRL
ncbi:MAG: class I SAM-dependent methyltransferase family protein [Candidatus Diapherotrites archaeon]|nr:class I SAM-dependent methyltransferase family protein [Candidatus Diapherotrites archaeon]